MLEAQIADTESLSSIPPVPVGRPGCDHSLIVPSVV